MEIKNPYALFFSNLCLRVSAGTQINFQMRSCHAVASVLSSSQSSGMEDTTVYPFWLSLICFAIVPAIIEEYIFRGVILGAYLKVEMMAAVLISSLLQSIGFKMVWVIQSKM